MKKDREMWILIPKVLDQKDNKVTRELDIQKTLLANKAFYRLKCHGVVSNRMISMSKPQHPKLEKEINLRG